MILHSYVSLPEGNPIRTMDISTLKLGIPIHRWPWNTIVEYYVCLRLYKDISKSRGFPNHSQHMIYCIDYIVPNSPSMLIPTSYVVYSKIILQHIVVSWVIRVPSNSSKSRPIQSCIHGFGDPGWLKKPLWFPINRWYPGSLMGISWNIHWYLRYLGCIMICWIYWIYWIYWI